MAISGLVRSFDLVDRGGPRLIHFAAINDRNGFFLLSRTPRPDFAWSDLVGRTVLSYSGAPTPWLCMQAVLRRHGIDPARVNSVRHLKAPDAVAAFRAGDADFLEHGPPLVDELVRDGVGHLVASMGEATGPLAFSSCMTTPDTLVHGREPSPAPCPRPCASAALDARRLDRGDRRCDRAGLPGHHGRHPLARRRALCAPVHLGVTSGTQAGGVRGAAGDSSRGGVHRKAPPLSKISWTRLSWSRQWEYDDHARQRVGQCDSPQGLLSL